jgi:hypothetical protein
MYVLAVLKREKPIHKQKRERIMPEPREDDDIALGLDEDEGEDESYDTLEEKYAD